MSGHIVVLGGGYAGTLGALRLGRRLKGKAKITLVSASDQLVERIRLHQRAVGGHPASRSLRPLVDTVGVALHVGEATEWSPQSRTLTTGGMTLRYDRLLYAAGSRTDIDRIPGARANALSLDGDAMAALTERLPRAQKIVICGGGLTAIEAATEIAERHPELRVTMVSAHPIGGFLSKLGAAYVGRVLDRLRVERIEGVAVRAVESHALQTDCDPIPFDLCLWAGGLIAAPLAWNAGLPVNSRGRLLVDGNLQLPSEPSIFGAGDAVAPNGEDPLMGCKRALPTGAHAAENLAAAVLGKPLTPFRYAPPPFCVSLGRHDGIVQHVTAAGAPREKIWSGPFAAWLKERICRYVSYSLTLEAKGIGYWWAKGAPPPPRRLLAEKAA